MFKLFNKPVALAGTVHFRGNLPPRAEEFEYLKGHGCEIKPRKPSEQAYWELEALHPRWGSATITALKAKPLPMQFLKWSVSLTDKEKEDAAAAGMGVSVAMNGTRKDALRERKNLFQYLSAITGDDGLVATDHVSTKFWSPGALRDEVLHDAEADISQLYEVHAIRADTGPEDEKKEDKPRPEALWVHTHGLGEIGAFDIDILRPNTDMVSHDMLRALAFAAAGGDLSPTTASFEIVGGMKPIRCVPASEFMRVARSSWTSLRDHDEHHSKDRVVLCDPTSFFSRLLGKGASPSRTMRTQTRDGMVIAYSNTATNVMSSRAAGTFPMFRAMREELAKFDLPALVKLGYKVNNASADAEREHMWFEVHEVTDGGIDATLLNAPHRVSRLKQGDRQVHPVELLTEWSIMTPFGHITPHNSKLARKIRENPEAFGHLLQFAGMMGGGGRG
jgi:uncharacterized protein YegJ (DUF2314 family)